ncbi:MAG: GntR family transcriptional regulator [Clostridiales bacterium]|nr:GntR family transcriptional regulator [Clostridiales bacterium]
MNVLHPIKMPTAKERAAAELRKAILSHQFQEGDVLTLDSVAAQLNISTTPVREAFQILARDNLIQLRPNKGAVVLGATERTIREHYTVRAILETGAIQLICDAHADVSAVKQCYDNALESLAKGNFQDYNNFNRSFHVEIWEATGNERLVTMCAELWNGLSMGIQSTEEQYARTSNREHKAILDPLLVYDKPRAVEAMHRHIMRSCEDMLTHHQER